MDGDRRVMGSAGTSVKVVEGGRLRLRLIGMFGVLQNGRARAAIEVGSRKARTTLALLAVQPERFVTVPQIMTALWGESPPRQAAANVATLVSRLRSSLGRNVIVSEGGRYRLNSTVEVDLYEAVELLEHAEGELKRRKASTAILAAREVLSLLGDETVLADYIDAVWAEAARALPSSLARRARLVVAEAALIAGDTVAAKRAAEQAVAEDRLDEPAHRALMCAHAVAGEPVRALATYARLRAALADELGIDPAPVTRAMHVAILRNEVPTPLSAALTGLTGRADEVLAQNRAWG
jgi:DNA-binding SARP family transcriptional activator